MKKAYDDVRVLLVQARNTADIEVQEQGCFLERGRLRPDQLAAINITRATVPESVLDEYDALFIGGAGEYSATDNHPWLPALLQLIREAGRRRVPTFGSCWGHQVIARAFGGTVIHDVERAELGARNILLTEAAADDPLFSPFPPRFLANTGHHDRVSIPPDGAVELAYNESQRYQAFRMYGWPMYGTQFHSELDADAERERLIAYRDYYMDELGSDDVFQETMASLAETTEVDHLLYDFIRVYVCGMEPSLKHANRQEHT